MQEQTKITVLLISVIVVAVLSLIFIFYQYGKVQTQFTARMIEMFPIKNTQPQIMQKIITTQDPKQICKKPNCYYNSKYYVGTSEIFTGNNDANGKNVRGCHPEKTELLMQVKTTTSCFKQKLTCIAGGWTTNTPQTNC